MRVAFYAPRKPPGNYHLDDKTIIANDIVTALKYTDNDVDIIGNFDQHKDGAIGEFKSQLLKNGKTVTENLLYSIKKRPKNIQPEAWITHNLYFNSPDFIGPTIARKLNIPYILTQASYDRKQSNGLWSNGLQTTAKAISQSQAIISFSKEDEISLLPLISRNTSIFRMLPFINTEPFVISNKSRTLTRVKLSKKYNLDIKKPWIVITNMMRPGNELASYRLLGRALWLIDKPNFHLLITGKGEASDLVNNALKSLGPKVLSWLEKNEACIPEILSACDMVAWPNYNELHSMALLKAQAAGLPIVMGEFQGKPEIMEDKVTGVLVSPWDDIAFAEAIFHLCEDYNKRKNMSSAALLRIDKHHSHKVAGRILNEILMDVVKKK